MTKSYLTIFLSIITLNLIAQQAPSKRYKPIILDSAYNHTKWGIKPIDIEYKFCAYTASYDSNDDNDKDGKNDLWGIPEWVAFEIKSKPNTTHTYSRPKWMDDDSLKSINQVTSDKTYAVSGVNKLKEVPTDNRYVRGHMCPKSTADRISIEAGYNTHTVLNAVPQLQWQNNGIWKALEKDCNTWADKYGSIWVVTGPLFFNKTPAIWLGQNNEVKAAVPDALFKIVIRETDNGIETLSFIFPNILPKAIETYHQYITSIKRIERLTGLSFLTNLSNSKRAKELKKHLNLSDNEKKALIKQW